MVTAIVLLDCEQNQINEVGEALAEMPEISEVYSVAGEWDLVAMVRVRDNDDLADVITSKMLQIDGILQTDTLIAFRVFSRHDLDDLFAIGFEKKSD